MLLRDRVHYTRAQPIYDAIVGALTGELPQHWYHALADNATDAKAEIRNQIERIQRQKDKPPGGRK